MRPDEDPPIVEVGGLVDETRVTLSIHGQDLAPDEVSAILGCTPTHSHRRGDTRPRNLPPRHAGVWLLAVEGRAPISPAALLDELLAKVPDDPVVWSRLRARFRVRVSFGLFLSAWNRGFDLPHASLERLAALGLAVDFDIYADEPEPDA